MEVIFLRQAHKFIRKADKSLRTKIKEEVLKIQANTKIGTLLSGRKFKKVRRHKFIFKKTNYRIAYQVKNNLIIISVATRENFYRDLQV